MKHIKRLISVVVILSMLMSVAAVASATVIGTDGLPTDMAGADKNHVFLDFENTTLGRVTTGSVGGLVASDLGQYIDFVDDGTGNKALKMSFTSSNALMLGSSENAVYGNKTMDCGSAFNLEADVTYRVTFRYKVLAGTYTDSGSITAALYYGTGLYPNGKRASAVTVENFFDIKTVSEDSYEMRDFTESKATVSCYYLTADTDWMTFDKTITVTAAQIKEIKDFAGVKNVNLYFNIQCHAGATTPHIKDCNVMVDDILIYNAEGTVYNYNFINDEDGTTNYTRAAGTGNALSFGEGDNNNIGPIETLFNKDIDGNGAVKSDNKNKASYVVTKDMIDGTTLAGDGSSLVHDGQTVAGGAYLGTSNGTPFTTEGWWAHYRMFIKDPDIDGGKWLTIAKGRKYAVTVKFKAGNGVIEGDKYGLAIGLGNSKEGKMSALMSEKGKLYEHSYVYDYQYDSSEPWHYITAIIDGDGTSYDGVTSAEVALAGRQLAVLPKVNGTSGGVFIESIEVTVFDKAKIGEKKVIVNVGDGTVAPTVELGYYGNRNEFGELIKYTKDGENWFSVTEDCIITGKDASAIGSTYTMEENNRFEIGDKFDSNYEYTVTDEEHGYALEINSIGNIGRVIFKNPLTIGKKYYISFDGKANADGKYLSLTLSRTTGTATNNTREFLMGWGTHNDSTAMKNNGVIMYKNGADVSSTDRSTHAGMRTCTYDSTWSKHGLIIDTTDPNFIANIAKHASLNGVTYFALGTINKGSIAYIDNLVITEISDTTPALPTEPLEATGSIRQAGMQTVDGVPEYVSAGLRFRGYIENSVKATASEIGFVLAPSKGVADDTAWYEFGENGKLKNSVARSTACYDSEKEVAYDSDENGTYYQLILSGLSTEAGRTAYKTRFTAVMYVKDQSGVYTYYALGESSYEQIKAAYRAIGYADWYKY